MIQDMKTILTRMFIVVVLIMISMAARADVKVLYGENGTEKFEGTGGTIEVKQEDSKDDKTKVTVTLIVTPSDGYTLAKDNSLEVYAVISPDGASTRALEISGDALKLDCNDFKDISQKRTYTVDIDSKLALWVKSADFTEKDDGSKGGGNRSVPFDLTTENDITNNTQKYYLIQSIDRPTFYAIPYSNADGSKVSTTSIPNANMRWCFVDAGSDSDHQYYYIVNSTGRCLYRNSDGNDGILIKKTYAELSSLSDAELNKYKFYLTQTGSDYFIQPKGASNLYLNKRGSNFRFQTDYHIKASTYSDSPSVWNFVAFGDVTWPQPFTVSTNAEKHYYKFQNVTNTSFCLSNSGEWATVSSMGGDKDIWYFFEAGVDATYSNFHYYYIVNAATGKYLYHTGGTGNDVAKVMDYNSAEDDKYRFLIVDAACKPTNQNYVTGYTIVPKLRQTNFSDKDSYAPMAMSDGSHLLLKSDRATGSSSSNYNSDSHWDIVVTDYSTACANPTITFSSATGEVTISTTTSNSAIHYTVDGITDPSSSVGTLYAGPFDVTEETTIKAIVTRTGFTDSEVVTETIFQVATPTIQNNGSNAISITCATEGATIYYETGGGTPTTSSTEYTGPLTDNVSGVTIRAIAVKDGMINSAIGTGSVTLQCAKPDIAIVGDNVTISCSFPSSGVSIYYTKDGGTPSSSSTLYSGSIPVTIGDVIKAVATATGYNDSEVAEKTVRAELTPIGDIYYINNDVDFETFVDMANTADGAGYHYILKANVNASLPISQTFTGTLEADYEKDATSDDFGQYYKIKGLRHPLFSTVSTGAVIKNVMLEDVQINQNGPVGAIAGTAEGYSRIYNCGILPSSNLYDAKTESSYLQSSGGANSYCGGIVGWLKGDSRVINCFSYANIKGGTDVAGIVGHNEAVYSDENGSYGSTTEVEDGKYYRLKTAVVNCMFYGDITDGSNRWPVYGGAKMTNTGTTAINNYDFYRSEASLGLADDEHYNCSFPAKEEYLTQYEYYRYLLNSNRELCGWWVGADDAPSGMTTAQVQTVPKDATLIAKWVLDPSIAPYPILKPAGKYSSIINQAPKPDETSPQRIDPETKKWVSRASSANTKMVNPKAAPEKEGQSLGKITVTIKKNSEDTGTDKTFTITAMDVENNDFCYGKIQLPYYNSIFGDPDGTTWADKYGGNYTDNVVIGWEITGVTGGTPGTLVKEDDATKGVLAWESGFNFADRNCTNKDKERVFAQGGYYYVPYEVSAITITAKWATAIYLDNGADHSYDRVYMSGSSAGTHFAPAGSRSTTLGNGKTPQTGTISSKLPDGSDVYGKAIVLVGNHQYLTGNSAIGSSSKACTIMSADFDLDDEPDYCLIWQLGYNVNRQSICPIRFDFLPVVEIGMGMKEDGSTQYYSLGCYRPLGHFEVTETSLIRFGQFEFSNKSRTIEAPVILNGGIFEQYVKGHNSHCMAGADDKINYVIVGGNVYMPSFTPGAHVNSSYPTRHCAVNVIGGKIDNFYLAGNYNENVTPHPDNPHCYIDGGSFEQVAAAGKEGIDGNVFFQINHSIIEEFYGGSTLASAKQLVTGSIDVTINNSYVTKFCGGPKFGNMNLDKTNPANNMTVTTNATGTTFGVYYGGGNGGTSYVQYDKTDGEQKVSTYSWESTGKLDSYSPKAYRSDGKNYKADYEMEIVNLSTGTNAGNAVYRTYFYAAQFSKTDTGPITNNLTNCTVLTNFYGGGNLGGVQGNVTSNILGTTHVNGSVYGAGYSASVPQVTIYEKSKTVPTINVYTGIITPTPDPDPTSRSTTYTWCYKNNSTNVVVPSGVVIPNTVSTSDPAFEYNGKQYFYTEESLENLGTVTGTVNLTIGGDAVVEGKVYKEDGTVDATKKGGVYGGGDDSAVEGSTFVTLKENARVDGNVFGGGNKGVVSGTATVNIE